MVRGFGASSVSELAGVGIIGIGVCGVVLSFLESGGTMMVSKNMRRKKLRKSVVRWDFLGFSGVAMRLRAGLAVWADPAVLAAAL